MDIIKLFLFMLLDLLFDVIKLNEDPTPQNNTTSSSSAKKPCVRSSMAIREPSMTDKKIISWSTSPHGLKTKRSFQL